MQCPSGEGVQLAVTVCDLLYVDSVRQAHELSHSQGLVIREGPCPELQSICCVVWCGMVWYGVIDVSPREGAQCKAVSATGLQI